MGGVAPALQSRSADGTYTYAYDSFNNITSRQAGTNATTFSYASLLGVGAGVSGSALAFAGGGMMGFGAAVSVAAVAAVVGVIVIGNAIALQLGVVFSKHDPGMSSKSPVSWTDIDKGIAAYKKCGSAEKAAEYLLNEKYGAGVWPTGSKTEHNALKKWLDRIIRLRVKKG